MVLTYYCFGMRGFIIVCKLTYSSFRWSQLLFHFRGIVLRSECLEGTPFSSVDKSDASGQEKMVLFVMEISSDRKIQWAMTQDEPRVITGTFSFTKSLLRNSYWVAPHSKSMLWFCGSKWGCCQVFTCLEVPFQFSTLFTAILMSYISEEYNSTPSSFPVRFHSGHNENPLHRHSIEQWCLPACPGRRRWQRKLSK